MTGNGNRAPNPMEQEALRIAIKTVPDPERRDALLRQMAALRVRARDFTGAGFFTDFDCPPELASPALSDDSNRHPPMFGLRYPNGHGALSFIIYVKDGVIDYLEGASSGMWSEEQAAAGHWPEDPGPVAFDPTLITA